MPKIEIINPLPGGMRFTSLERAQHFCRLGMATLSHDGRLLFKLDNQERLELRQLSADAEFQRNRGGILYWNGARSILTEADVDIATHLPGENVLFPKTGTVAAARRYCRGER